MSFMNFKSSIELSPDTIGFTLDNPSKPSNPEKITQIDAPSSTRQRSASESSRAKQRRTFSKGPSPRGEIVNIRTGLSSPLTRAFLPNASETSPRREPQPPKSAPTTPTTTPRRTIQFMDPEALTTLLSTPQSPETPRRRRRSSSEPSAPPSAKKSSADTSKLRRILTRQPAKREGLPRDPSRKAKVTHEPEIRHSVEKAPQKPRRRSNSAPEEVASPTTSTLRKNREKSVVTPITRRLKKNREESSFPSAPFELPNLKKSVSFRRTAASDLRHYQSPPPKFKKTNVPQNNQEPQSPRLKITRKFTTVKDTLTNPVSLDKVVDFKETLTETVPLSSTDAPHYIWEEKGTKFANLITALTDLPGKPEGVSAQLSLIFEALNTLKIELQNPVDLEETDLEEIDLNQIGDLKFEVKVLHVPSFRGLLLTLDKLLQILPQGNLSTEVFTALQNLRSSFPGAIKASYSPEIQRLMSKIALAHKIQENELWMALPYDLGMKVQKPVIDLNTQPEEPITAKRVLKFHKQYLSSLKTPH